jgi:hypothetical protein
MAIDYPGLEAAGVGPCATQETADVSTRPTQVKDRASGGVDRDVNALRTALLEGSLRDPRGCEFRERKRRGSEQQADSHGDKKIGGARCGSLTQMPPSQPKTRSCHSAGSNSAKQSGQMTLVA